jgi:hypothetical protein
MWGGTQRLPRRVGAAKAIELMATCRRLDGREAERIGLATQCVPDAGFDAAVTGMAREILANSWHSNASIKQLVHQTDGLTLRDGLAHEQFRSPGSRRRGVFPPSPVRTGATPLMTQTPANADWPRQGGCLCGAVRYTISSAPGAAVVCHCTHCQKQGGSLFAFNLVLADTQYEQHGTTKVYTDSGDSGQPVYRHFCADCGSPGMVIVKGGTLDDRSGLSPRMEVYCRSSEPWLPALPVQARFDTMPPTPQVKP